MEEGVNNKNNIIMFVTEPHNEATSGISSLINFIKSG